MILRRLPTEASPWDKRSTEGRQEDLLKIEGNPGSGKRCNRRSWISAARFSARGLSLRSRLSALVALTVLVTIVVITFTAYKSVSQVLYTELDKNLQSRAQAALDQSQQPFPDDFDASGKYIPAFMKSRVTRE